MAYNVYFCCDKCGITYSWINHSVSLSIAIKMARDAGWSVGKRGWYCPKCRKKNLLSGALEMSYRKSEKGDGA